MKEDDTGQPIEYRRDYAGRPVVSAGLRNIAIGAALIVIGSCVVWAICTALDYWHFS